MGKKKVVKKKSPKKKAQRKNKIPKMSQSLMKSLFKYKIGEECGLVLKAKYIDNISFPSTDNMELGNYFEYICTGALPRDKHLPEPKILKSGKMSAPYLRMEAQKENFLKIMSSYGLKIVDKGYVFKKGKYSFSKSTLKKKLNGSATHKISNLELDKFIIDLKTSGLLWDKWSAWGWDDSSIETKDELLIQAVHYKHLAKLEWGIDNIPFYFFVFSNTNDTDFKIFEIIVSEETMEMHILNLENAIEYFKTELKKGITAHPSLKRCSGCYLKKDCKSFVDVPQVQQVYY